MIATSCTFETLGDRQSFNASVRHIKSTVALAERVADGENLADILNELLDEKAITPDEIQPIVSMLLVGKFSYATLARNLGSVAEDISSISESVTRWKAADLVVVYHHPDLGVMVLNPKNPAHAARLDRLNKYELMAVYAGGFGKSVEPALALKAAEALLSLYEGKPAKADVALTKGSFAYKAPKEKPAAKTLVAARPPKRGPVPKAAVKKTSGKASKASVADAPIAAKSIAQEPSPVAAAPKPGSRMTPMYAVLVTNELFHNGNVEAWKRIIESFKVKHPDLDVLVYYDKERITNLNALFKWGKVKHGNVIQFAVAGENICDVAKLQRYLAQGASPMFEAFLRGPVNGILPLF